MPAAPPTFSMTSCCPSASDMPTARMRAAVSVELPAANGTTTVTGRVGQVCAEAGAVVATAASVQSANNARRDGMIFS